MGKVKVKNGGKGTGNKKQNHRSKIDKGRLKIVQEMEKPKNLSV